MLEIKSYDDWTSSDDQEQTAPVDRLKSYANHVRSGYYKAGMLNEENEQEIIAGVRERALSDGIITEDMSEEDQNKVFGGLVGPTQNKDTDARFVLDHFSTGSEDGVGADDAKVATLTKYLSLKQFAPEQASELDPLVDEVLADKSLIKRAKMSAVDRGDYSVAAIDEDDGGRSLYTGPTAKPDSIKGEIDLLLASGAISSSDLYRVDQSVKTINGGLSNTSENFRFDMFRRTVGELAKTDKDLGDLIQSAATSKREAKTAEQNTTGEAILEGAKTVLAYPFIKIGEAVVGAGNMLMGKEEVEPAYAPDTKVSDILAGNNEIRKKFSAEEIEKFSNDLTTTAAGAVYRADRPETGIGTDSMGNTIIAPQLLANKKAFETAVTAAPLNKDQQKQVRLERDVLLERAAPDLLRTILDEEPDAVGAFAKAKANGLSDKQFVEQWVGETKNYDGFNNRLEQFGKSAWKTVAEIPLGLAALSGNEWAAGQMVGMAKDQSRREEYGKLFGDQFGLGFQILNVVPQIATDIALTIGTGGVFAGAKTLAKAGSASARSTLRASAKFALSEVDDAAAISFKSAITAGGEAEVGNAIRNVGASLATKFGEQAPLFAVSFTRSATSTYGSIYGQMPDTMSHDDKHKAALGYAMAAGLSTGVITSGMGLLGRGGVEQIATNRVRAMLAGETDDSILASGGRVVPVDKMNFRQAKQVYENLKNEGNAVTDVAFQKAMRGAIGGTYKNWLRTTLNGGINESVEEALDQGIQIKLEEAALDKETSLSEKVAQVFTAGLIGGALGGAMGGATQFGSVNKSEQALVFEGKASALEVVAKQLRKTNSSATADYVQRMIDDARAKANAATKADIELQKANEVRAESEKVANALEKQLADTPEEEIEMAMLGDLVGQNVTAGGMSGVLEEGDDGMIRMTSKNGEVLNLGSRYEKASGRVSFYPKLMTTAVAQDGIPAGTPYITRGKKGSTRIAMPTVTDTNRPENFLGVIRDENGRVIQLVVKNAPMISNPEFSMDVKISNKYHIDSLARYYNVDLESLNDLTPAVQEVVAEVSADGTPVEVVKPDGADDLDTVESETEIVSDKQSVAAVKEILKGGAIDTSGAYKRLMTGDASKSKFKKVATSLEPQELAQLSEQAEAVNDTIQADEGVSKTVKRKVLKSTEELRSRIALAYKIKADTIVADTIVEPDLTEEQEAELQRELEEDLKFEIEEAKGNAPTPAPTSKTKTPVASKTKDTSTSTKVTPQVVASKPTVVADTGIGATIGQTDFDAQSGSVFIETTSNKNNKKLAITGEFANGVTRWVLSEPDGKGGYAGSIPMDQKDVRANVVKALGNKFVTTIEDAHILAGTQGLDGTEMAAGMIEEALAALSKPTVVAAKPTVVAAKPTVVAAKPTVSSVITPEGNQVLPEDLVLKERRKILSDLNSLEGARVFKVERDGEEVSVTLTSALKIKELYQGYIDDTQTSDEARLAFIARIAGINTSIKKGKNLLASRKRRLISSLNASLLLDEEPEEGATITEAEQNKYELLNFILNNPKPVAEAPPKIPRIIRPAGEDWSTEDKLRSFRNQEEESAFNDLVNHGFILSELNKYGASIAGKQQEQLGFGSVPLFTKQRIGDDPTNPNKYLKGKHILLRREVLSRFPLVQVDTGYTSVKSKRPYTNSEKGTRGLIDLPVYRDLEKNIIGGAFTNDVHVTRAQIDQNIEIYVPKELIAKSKDVKDSFKLNPSIEVDPVTGRVMSVIDPITRESVRFTGDSTSIVWEGYSGYMPVRGKQVMALLNGMLAVNASKLKNAGATATGRVGVLSSSVPLQEYVSDFINFISGYDAFGDDNWDKMARTYGSKEKEGDVGRGFKLLKREYGLSDESINDLSSSALADYTLNLHEFAIGSALASAAGRALSFSSRTPLTTVVKTLANELGISVKELRKKDDYQKLLDAKADELFRVSALTERVDAKAAELGLTVEELKARGDFTSLVGLKAATLKDIDAVKVVSNFFASKSISSIAESILERYSRFNKAGSPEAVVSKYAEYLFNRVNTPTGDMYTGAISPDKVVRYYGDLYKRMEINSGAKNKYGFGDIGNNVEALDTLVSSGSLRIAAVDPLYEAPSSEFELDPSLTSSRDSGSDFAEGFAEYGANLRNSLLKSLEESPELTDAFNDIAGMFSKDLPSLSGEALVDTLGNLMSNLGGDGRPIALGIVNRLYAGDYSSGLRAAGIMSELGWLPPVASLKAVPPNNNIPMGDINLGPDTSREYLRGLINKAKDKAYRLRERATPKDEEAYRELILRGVMAAQPEILAASAKAEEFQKTAELNTLYAASMGDLLRSIESKEDPSAYVIEALSSRIESAKEALTKLESNIRFVNADVISEEAAYLNLEKSIAELSNSRMPKEPDAQEERAVALYQLKNGLNYAIGNLKYSQRQQQLTLRKQDVLVKLIERISPTLEAVQNSPATGYDFVSEIEAEINKANATALHYNKAEKEAKGAAKAVAVYAAMEMPHLAAVRKMGDAVAVQSVRGMRKQIKSVTQQKDIAGMLKYGLFSDNPTTVASTLDLLSKSDVASNREIASLLYSVPEFNDGLSGAIQKQNSNTDAVVSLYSDNPNGVIETLRLLSESGNESQSNLAKFLLRESNPTVDISSSAYRRINNLKTRQYKAANDVNSEAMERAARKKNTEDMIKYGLQSNDPDSVIDTLRILSKSKIESHREVAKLLLLAPDFIRSVKFGVVDLRTDWAGIFDAGTNTVLINLAGHNGRGLADVLLHEYLHAATVSYFTNPRTAEQREAVTRIGMLRELATVQATKKGLMRFAHVRNALASNEEFLTATLTTPEFQTTLASLTPTGQRSLFGRLVDYILALFGKRNKFISNAIKELLDFSEMSLASFHTYNNSMARDYYALSEAAQRIRADLEDREYLNNLLDDIQNGRPEDFYKAESSIKPITLLSNTEEIDAQVRFTPEERSRWVSLRKAAIQEFKTGVDITTDNQLNKLDDADAWKGNKPAEAITRIEDAWRNEIKGIIKRSGVDGAALTQKVMARLKQTPRVQLSQLELNDFNLSAADLFFFTGPRPMMDMGSDTNQNPISLENAIPNMGGEESFEAGLASLYKALAPSLRSSDVEQRVAAARLAKAYIEAFAPEEQIENARKAFTAVDRTRYVNAIDGTESGTNKIDVVSEIQRILPDGITLEFDNTMLGQLDARRSRPNSIIVNPDTVNDLVYNLTPANARSAVRTFVDEELAHLASYRTFTEDDFVSIAKNMGEDMRNLVADMLYSNSISDYTIRQATIAKDLESGALRESDIAAEWVRSEMTRMAVGRSREENLAFLRTNPSLLAKFLEAVRAFITKLKAQFESSPTASTAAKISMASREFRSMRNGGVLPVPEATTEGELGDTIHFINAVDGNIAEGQEDRTNFELPIASTNPSKVADFWKKMQQKMYDMPLELRRYVSQRDGAIASIEYTMEDFGKKFPKLRDEAINAGIAIEDIGTILGTTAPAVQGEARKELRSKVRQFKADNASDPNVTRLAEDYEAKLAQPIADRFYAEFRKNQKVMEDQLKAKGFGPLVDYLVEFRQEINKYKIMIKFDESNDVYLTRTFNYFTTEGWALAAKKGGVVEIDGKTVDFDKLRTLAANHFRSEVLFDAKQEGQTLTEDQIATKTIKALDAYLIDLDKRAADAKELGSMNTIKRDINRLLYKKDIDEPLRALLGEVTDPFENAVRTIYNVGRLAANDRFLRNFSRQAVKLELASYERKDGMELLFPSSLDAELGDLAGLYVRSDIAAAVRQELGPKNRDQETRSMEQINSIGKGLAWASGAAVTTQTLGSVGFYPRNILGGMALSAAQGIINPLYAKESVRLALRANLLESDSKETRDTIRRLVELQILRDDTRGRMAMDMLKGFTASTDEQLDELLNELVEAQATGNISKIAKRFNLKKGAASTVEFLASLNNVIDSAFKVNAYMYELDQLKKAYGTESIGKLEVEAARKAKFTFPTHSEQMSAAKSFNKSPFSMIVLPFVRWKSEVIRTMLNTIPLAMEEINSGNDVMRARGIKRLTGFSATILGGGTAFGLVFGTLFSLLTGGDDDKEGNDELGRMLTNEELDSLREGLPDYQRNHGVFARLIGKDGVQVIDMSNILPYSQVTDIVKLGARGNVKGIGEYIAKDLIGTQIAASALFEVAKNEDSFGNPIALESDNAAQAYGKLLVHAAKSAFLPSIAKKGYQVARYGQQDAGLLIAGELTGARPTVTKLSDIEYRAMTKIKSAMDENVAMLYPLSSARAFDPSDVEGLLSDQQAASNVTQKRLYDFIQGMKSMGSTEDSLIATATKLRISKQRMGNVLMGLNSPWIPNSAWFTKMAADKTRGGEQDPNEIANEVIRIKSNEPDQYSSTIY